MLLPPLRLVLARELPVVRVLPLLLQLLQLLLGPVPVLVQGCYLLPPHPLLVLGLLQLAAVVTTAEQRGPQHQVLLLLLWLLELGALGRASWKGPPCLRWLAAVARLLH